MAEAHVHHTPRLCSENMKTELIPAPAFSEHDSFDCYWHTTQMCNLLTVIHRLDEVTVDCCLNMIGFAPLICWEMYILVHSLRPTCICQAFVSGSSDFDSISRDIYTVPPPLTLVAVRASLRHAMT